MKKIAIKWLSFKVLNFIDSSTKRTFRKLEEENRKIIKNEEHLNFNKICFKENLLPKYTDFKLHDATAREADFVVQCRMLLTERQINEKTQAIEYHKNEAEKILDALRTSVSTEMRYEALLLFLERLMVNHRLDLI